MGLAGIRSTHNPAVMLAHDRHGYPPGFVSFSEPNTALHDIAIDLNPDVTEAEFQRMLGRAGLQSMGLSLKTVQRRVYDSYWGVGGASESDGWAPMLLQMDVCDLRRLLSPMTSSTQAVHPSELR